jgi:uncharacterized protein (TIGR02996 family)
MTDLEDGVAALLAEPENGAVHAQLVDRLCDESPDPRRALLDLVLAHKKSDGPRLAYALFCDLNGDKERAEFIRVQCEIAGLSVNPDWFIDSTGEVRERNAELCHRERELFAANGVNQREWMGAALHDLCVAGTEWLAHLPWFRRGFVTSLTCRAEEWLKCGDAVAGEHPVERVELRTPPPIRFSPIRETSRPNHQRKSTVFRAEWEAMVECNGGTSRTFAYQVEITERDASVGGAEHMLGNFRQVVNYHHTPEGYLYARWPGIEFVLPTVT